MTPGEISQAIQDTAFFTALRESGLPYPIILASHLTTIAIFGGLILMSDLRLLGLALTDVPVSEVLLRTRPWKRVGFVIMVTLGMLLAGSKLFNYYDNPYFQVKMTLLALVGVHAIVFRRPRVRESGAVRRSEEDAKGRQSRGLGVHHPVGGNSIHGPMDRVLRAARFSSSLRHCQEISVPAY